MPTIEKFFFLPRNKREGITDSVLLKSGQEILYGEVDGLSISVVVCGEVRIKYKGETYTDPEEFPKALVRTLRRCKNIFLPDKSIKNPPEILNNNWYEMRIERDDKHLQDDILDLDLSTMSEEDARSLLLDSAKQYNMHYPMRRFVDPRSGTVIHAPLGACLINLTDRPCDLAPAFLEAVKETPEYDELLGRINTTDDLRVILDNDALTNDPRWESYEMKEFIHDLHDVLSKYAPEGYSFGVNCDKLKNYGYWKNDQ